MNENLDAPASATIHTIASPAAHGAIGTLQSLSLRSMFWRPAYFKDSPWLEHLPFAFWLIEAIRPRVFVEVGVDAGVSYFAFCQAVERLRLDTRCYAVHGAKGEAAFDAIHAHNEGQYAAFSRLLRSDFDGARGQFAAGSIDLLHLNGAVHDVEEFEAWLPKLSERAVVLVHGIEARDADSGIPRLFSALKRRYPHFEFVQGDGLGVLGAGPGLSTLAQQLFEAQASEPMRQAVQEVFARLGRACADQHAAATQLARAQDFASQVTKQQKQLDEVKQSLDKTKADLNNRSKELTEARTRLQTQLEQHAVERGQLAERVSLLQEIRGELKDESARLQAQIDSARAELARRFEEIKALAIESAEHKAHVAASRSALESREAELGRSQDALERARAELADAVKARQLADEQQAAAKAADAQRLVEVTRLGAEIQQLEAGSQQQADEAAAREVQLQRALSHAQQHAAASEGLASHQMMTLREQLASEQALRVAAQQALQAAQDEDAKLKPAHDALLARLQERDAEVECLQGETARLADENQRTGTALAASEERIRAQASAFALAQETATQAQEKLNALFARLQAGDEQLRELRAQANLQSDEGQRLRAENAQLQEKLKQRFDETAKLTAMMAEDEGKKARAECAALQAELKTRERELAGRAAEATKQADEIARQQAANAQAQASLQARFAETAKLTGMVAEMEKQLLAQHASEDALRAESDRKDKALRETEASRERLVAELAAVRKQMAIQKDRLHSLKQTASWKLTAPLRLIATPFRKSKRQAPTLEHDLQLLRESGLFDPAWYLKRYSSVLPTGIDPLVHYLRFGTAERRDPGPKFSTAEYLKKYPDIASAGINPLLHFAKHGKTEGRSAIPVEA